MSNLIVEENHKIFAQKEPSIILPSSPKTISKINEDFLMSHEDKEQMKQNKKQIKSQSEDDPFERLKKLEEMIDNKNQHVNNIYTRLDKLNEIEKNVKNPKNIFEKLETHKEEKLKKKLNLNIISLNKKLTSITEKEKKIEDAILFNGSGGGSIPDKERLKEIKDKKELILLKIKENNDEIKKMNEKDKKSTYKEKQRTFIENLEKIKENYTQKFNVRKNILKLSNDNINSNANEEYNKCLQEEQLQKRIKEDQLKELKYKELREKELERIKQRKLNTEIKHDKSLVNNDWLKEYANGNNYFLWEKKEKERRNKEESLIALENKKRKMMFCPISSEELNNFSNEVRNNQMKLKNDLKLKKLQLEELWRERKELIPSHKSKFELSNIQRDNEFKQQQILKKERIMENRLERINFSQDVTKNFKPKYINDKLKNERLERIQELAGTNKKNEIKALSNRLKLKSIQIIKSQPKNFRVDNNFVIQETIAEQQAKKIKRKEEKLRNLTSDKNYIKNNDNDEDNIAQQVKKWKNILKNNGDIFNIEENEKIKQENENSGIVKENENNEDKDKIEDYKDNESKDEKNDNFNIIKEEKNINLNKIENNNSNKIKESKGNFDVNIKSNSNGSGKNNIDNKKNNKQNSNVYKSKEYIDNKKFIESIEKKLNFINQYVGQ
jgi:hypothetical protein